MYYEIVGVDGGNRNIKLYGGHGEMKFPSTLGEYRERKLESNFSDDDIVFEFNGRKGFAGTLAQYESEFCGNLMGDNKAHDEMLIRVLIGLHRYCENTNFKIVVGQPISSHSILYKQKLIGLLEGEHTITVNNETKNINILEVKVAAEGGSAFWSNPRKGITRIIDVGSGTVNCATLNEGRYIDKDSFTLKYGMNTNLSKDLYSMCRAISMEALKKWDIDDTVLLVGGASEQLVEPFSEFFTNVKLLQPKVMVRKENGGGSYKFLSPVYANAVGFYMIGKGVFINEQENEDRD